MGERGPPKTPKKVLELRGSWRGKRAPDDPIENPGEPPIPSWLPESAHKHWHILAQELLIMEVLTTADGAALGLLADTMRIYLDASKAVEISGMTSVGSGVGEIINPAMRIMNMAADRMAKLLREFGLTPSSRAGVTKATPTQSTGKGKYLDNA